MLNKISKLLVIVCVLGIGFANALVVEGTSHSGDAEVFDRILGYHYYNEFYIDIESNNDIYIIWPDEEFMEDDVDDRDRYFQAFIAIGDVSSGVSWETGNIYIVFTNESFMIPHYASNPEWLNNNWEQMSEEALSDYIDNALRQTKVASYMEDYERLRNMVNEF